MFDSYFKPDVPYKKGSYSLRCPVDSDWETASNRILIVIETVDTHDIKDRQLLHDRAKTVVANLLRYSLDRAKEKGLRRKDVAFAAVNFNNEKFMDKPKEMWPPYRAEFVKRVKVAIADLEPTTVLVFGDYAAQSLLPDVDFLPKKRGWVFDLEANGHKCKMVPSLDLLPLYTLGKKDEQADEDDGEDEGEGESKIYTRSNLLFYVTNHVINALLGRMLYDLSKVKVRPRLVDTIEKFDKLYRRLKTEEKIAVDTETENLTVNHNKMKTIQFAFDDSGKGYMLPVDHEETPFSAKETRYIKKRLRKFFYAKTGELPCKYLIAVNGKFDNRIIRKSLGIPIIFHPIWEITAGEWLLDENRTALKDSPFGTAHGGLEQTLFVYGNDFYKRSKFSKEDRSNPNLTKISNPDFIKYGCGDVVFPWCMHQMQLERASDLTLGDKNYKPFFRRLVINQMSNTVHAISHMEAAGISIDRNYLALLKSKASPLLKLIADLSKDLMSTKELKQANAKLLDEGSGQKTNKGLFDTVLSVFDFGKAEHQMLLFFGVLGLEPISHTKTGKPQVNVSFIKAYKRDNVIVEKFGKLVKLKKLWSTYVKGWWNKIQDSPDSKLDWMLRAAYGFFDVVTGRLNSMKPSLQQVPSRGPEAKYIKRSFRAPPGHVHVKFDYSAHEVRVWSMISFDLVLASVFKVGQELRRKLRQLYSLPTNSKFPLSEEDIKKLEEELKSLNKDEKRQRIKEIQHTLKADRIFKDLKKRGDIHLLNVKRFFDMWVDKEHPLRDAIKSVVFGVIYQKSAKSLAKDIRTTAKNNLDDKKYALKNELKATPAPTKARVLEIKDALLKLKPDYVELAGDDKVKLAKDIMTKMFAEFKKGAAWLEWSKAHAEKNYYTYSPIGVRRNLFGVMTGINGIVAGLLRRAANSPVQGLASMIGVTGSRLVVVEMWDVLTKFGFMDENTEVMPVDILKQVHDAQYSEVPYEIMLIFIHVMQWTVTYGVTKHYKDVYNFEFTVEPEIEVEIGATEDKHYKWSFTNSNLNEIILKTLDDQVALKDLDAESRKEAETKIWAIYEDPKYKKLKRYLHTNYPILGVVPEEYK